MIEPGDAAPDFSLPAVHREGTVSLSDYRGRSPVLLALFRGFYCPFCRRQMGLLAAAADKLKDQGLEVLGVAASIFRSRSSLGASSVTIGGSARL